MGLKTVNIRALKDRLSSYLREVAHGDVFLVTDRGRVVAELRQPTLGAHALDAVQDREQLMIDRGDLRRGLPNTSEAYRNTGVRLADTDIDAALAWTRG